MDTLNLLGWLAVRLTLSFLYLYALSMNIRDKAARTWLVEHTTYMFPNTPQPQRTQLANWFAVIGMIMMFLGGISVLLGLEGRIGALLLLVFTAGGIYQHKREREVAMEEAQKVEPFVAASAKTDFATLQWSAYSGHFSSGLKNWALCGICAGIVVWGTGPWSISDQTLSLFR